MAQIVDTPARRAFMKQLSAQGWIGMTWPKEYGGQEKQGVYEYLLNEALARRGAPQIGKGAGIVGKTLIRHASDKLKREFLPQIVRGEIEFAVGYSEPQAGSDAANMQLKAEKVEGGWNLNGQKIWTTSAHFADWYWLGARTDPDKAKHDGISLFLIPMNHPGLTVQATPTIGDERTNTVFFNDVFVPDDYLVGQRGSGFQYVSEALDLERFTMFTFSPIEQRLEELVDYVRREERDGEPLRENPLVRQRIAQLATQAEVARALGPALRRGFHHQGQAAHRRGVGVQALRDAALAARRERGARHRGRGRAAARAHRGCAAARAPRDELPLLGDRHDRRRRVRDPEEHHRAPQARPAEELLNP